MKRLWLTVAVLVSLLALLLSAGCERTPESNASQEVSATAASSGGPGCATEQADCEYAAESCEGCPSMKGTEISQAMSKADHCEHAGDEAACPGDCEHHETDTATHACACSDHGDEGDAGCTCPHSGEHGSAAPACAAKDQAAAPTCARTCGSPEACLEAGHQGS